MSGLPSRSLLAWRATWRRGRSGAAPRVPHRQCQEPRAPPRGMPRLHRRRSLAGMGRPLTGGAWVRLDPMGLPRGRGPIPLIRMWASFALAFGCAWHCRGASGEESARTSACARGRR
eukprot:4840610-Alexandrium_andersonii.AAC.1